MYINLNIGRENNLFNIFHLNQNLAKDGPGTKKGVQFEQRDTVSISKMGRGNRLIEGLMERKQNIMEQKEKLKSNTLEKGGTLEDIKDELKGLDEQIHNIDQIIAERIAEQSQKQEEMKIDIYSQQMTREEVENERFIHLTDISSNLDQAKVISSVKRKIDGESQILKAQIKTGYGDIASKREQVEKLDKQSASLVSRINEKLTKSIENNPSQIIISEDADDNKVSQENNG